jgi:Ca2+-binding EF-hand superfamily protein
MTPEGLVLQLKRHTGFWFIPRSDLDRAIAAIAAAQPPPLRTNEPAPPLQVFKTPPAGQDVEINRIMAMHDKDLNGRLDLDELTEAIRTEELFTKLASPPAKVQQDFLLISPYDTNHNKGLELTEISVLLQNRDPFRLPNALRQYDSNNDGILDKEEVATLRKQQRAAQVAEILAKRKAAAALQTNATNQSRK